MKKVGWLLLLIGLVLALLTHTGMVSFQEPFVQRLPAQLPPIDPVVAFVDVTVIPMDSERALKHQTVIIRDGVIATVRAAGQVAIPPGARLIEGHGRYLMPGLVDMHAHIEYPNDLLLLVANGVTSIRNMWGNTGRKLALGFPDQLKLKQAIEQGKLFGPTLYTAGPLMEGTPPFHPLAEVFATPAEATRSVLWQAEQGYDFIKVYDHLSPEAYVAILETARAKNLPVVGHVPVAVGLDGVLAGDQATIEHLQGYIDADTAQFLIPTNQLAEYAIRTRAAGIWNCPTLSVYIKNRLAGKAFEQVQQQPGMAYQSPFSRWITPFLYQQMSAGHTYAGADYSARMATLNRQMVQALHQAGAGLLLGTDAAQPYHLPGYAIHEELALLVEAGLSPYEALAAGTRNAALALHDSDHVGLVAEGLRADLLLLDANPLADVAYVRRISGVMLRGQWIAQEQMQAVLSDLARSTKVPIAARVAPLILVLVGLVLSLPFHKK